MGNSAIVLLVVCGIFGVNAGMVQLFMLQAAYCTPLVGIVTDSWVQMAIPANPPSGRDSQSAVVNLINNTMVLFGGKDTISVFNNISLFLLGT